MGLIGSIIIGFLAGMIAGWLSPGRKPQGCLITILLGVAGAVFATYAGRWLGFYEANDNAGFIASVVGAMALLALGRLISSR